MHVSRFWLADGQSTLGQKIRDQFIKNSSKDAMTTEDSGVLDKRRWGGRTPDACIKMWKKVRAACTKFLAIKLRIDGMDLTGNPTDEDILRCCT